MHAQTCGGSCGRADSIPAEDWTRSSNVSATPSSMTEPSTLPPLRKNRRIPHQRLLPHPLSRMKRALILLPLALPPPTLALPAQRRATHKTPTTSFPSATPRASSSHPVVRSIYIYILNLPLLIFHRLILPSHNVHACIAQASRRSTGCKYDAPVPVESYFFWTYLSYPRLHRACALPFSLSRVPWQCARLSSLSSK